jgi:hypothetical protein
MPPVTDITDQMHPSRRRGVDVVEVGKRPQPIQPRRIADFVTNFRGCFH